MNFNLTAVSIIICIAYIKYGEREMGNKTHMSGNETGEWTNVSKHPHLKQKCTYTCRLISIYLYLVIIGVYHAAFLSRDQTRYGKTIWHYGLWFN